jgi:hypothetical protein
MIMNSKYVRIWKKTLMAYFKTLSWHSPGETEDRLLGYLMTVSITEVKKHQMRWADGH